MSRRPRSSDERPPRRGGDRGPRRGDERPPRRGEDGDASREESPWVVGRNAVRELLERGRESAVEKVIVAEDLPAAFRGQLTDLARAAGAILQAVPRRNIDAIADGAAHQGVAARTAPRPLLRAREESSVR